MKYEVFYADTPAKVAKVVTACRRAFDRGEPIGFDTEFYGVEVGKQSPYARARIHMFSLAVKRWPTVVAPRGYDVADAAVLLGTSIPDLREVFEHEGIKCVHNLPVDAHSLANHGVRLHGAVNTLAMARWAWPHRARAGGFTLDALGEVFLGAGKTESFVELFREEVTEFRSTYRRVKACECGTPGCRRRSTTPGHARHEEVVETLHPKVVMKPVPLESVVPGHPLWERALRYAAQDAVLALGVHDLAVREMAVEREIPWVSESDIGTSLVPGQIARS